MTISLERQANIGNGLLVVLSSLLGWYEPTRMVGIALGVFMGIGLIFSGVVNYCGWYRIFAKMPWNRVRSS
jgi:hypothetical protein